jgi:hypothetical protein
MVSRTLVAAIAILVAACTSSHFTRADAERIARAEVAKHGHSVPYNWHTRVEFGYHPHERPKRPTAVVHFQRGPATSAKAFEVAIDVNTRKVIHFLDAQRGIVIP